MVAGVVFFIWFFLNFDITKEMGKLVSRSLLRFEMRARTNMHVAGGDIFVRANEQIVYTQIRVLFCGDDDDNDGISKKKNCYKGVEHNSSNTTNGTNKKVGINTARNMQETNTRWSNFVTSSPQRIPC